MRICTLVTLCCFLTSCYTIVPEHYDVMNKAYPPNDMASPASAPPESIKKSTFEAPYEDVYRAATIAASQAQFNIESSDKSKGLILAERIALTGKVGDNAVTQTKFFYAITVKELGPKVTEVAISSKAQTKCRYTSPGTHVVTTIFSFGIWLLFIPAIVALDNQCKEAAEIHWDATMSLEQLTQFMTFTRNNLIAAGVL
jgi:hypothetical protein